MTWLASLSQSASYYTILILHSKMEIGKCRLSIAVFLGGLNSILFIYVEGLQTLQFDFTMPRVSPCSSRGAKLCSFGDVQVTTEKRFTVQQHCKTSKHVKYLSWLSTKDSRQSLLFKNSSTNHHHHHFILFVYFVYLWLCCIAPQYNYIHVHCAVSVIGLTAVDSAHR
jgi:hypothetical protein